MEFFTNEVMGDLLARSLETAEFGPDGFLDTGAGPGSAAGGEIDWRLAEVAGATAAGKPLVANP